MIESLSIETTTHGRVLVERSSNPQAAGWLVAFLAVIQPASQSAVDVPLPPRALLSSAIGLIGVIATDYLLRRSQQTGRELSPVTWWVIGWLSLAPAWLIVTINL